MNIIIPDTSSLINIHDIYVGPNHIIDVLSELFDVRVSKEIPHEVRRHKDKLGSYDKPMLKFVRQARQYFHPQQKYENLLFTNFSRDGNLKRNRGERYNCALALYQVRRRITGQVIMLIDDMKARRGLIDWYEGHFKTTRTWSSLDLLLHIYLVIFPKWSYAQAETALKKVNSSIGGTHTEMTNRLLKYRRHLTELRTMLRALPLVKKVSR
jgi:hypothetical protein